ncbi:hypothetical protein WMY93_008270 [Mugilogobius chulae]|uniref:UDP-glucuronosyltransferase n=1 Tax=Mugilogobius chulae TaxID=88201 RepID=A0AAW0PJ16_9GOBI
MGEERGQGQSTGKMSKHYSWIACLLSLCVISLAPASDGGNILVFPVDGSHWINMKPDCDSSSNSWYIAEQSPLYTTISLEMEIGLEDFFGIFLVEQLKAQREGASALTFLKLTKDFLKMIGQAHAIWCDALKRILEDNELVKSLLDAKYDLMLTDPAIAPGVVLAKYLKLPLVLNVRWVTSGDGQFLLAPSPLSYIPVPGSGLTDKMNFLQRVKNLLHYSITLVQQYFLVGPSYDAICEKYIEGGCDIISLLQDADIWLFRSDFVFDFPRPTMPNVIYMGGFQCKPAQPLPAELEDFVQSAGEHGVIIMTLGTLVHALPPELADEIASVFAKLPQKVIWRHKGERPNTLGNNTLIVDWMPQKDLLGHPQIKVFVAHGGTNGVQEAIYHGVPVLGIPLFFDQYDNLLRVQVRGAGKIISLSDLNGDSFEQGLRELLHQSHYRDNMQRLSRLHRDQPMSPMDQAVFWVEYVIRHKGAPHLRTQAFKMPWFSYYCLDVLLLLLAALCGTVFCVVALFRFLCCRNRNKIKQKLQ